MKLLTLFATIALTTTAAFCESATLDSLKGTYVFTEQGGVGTNQVMAGLGTMTLDGKGGVSCAENIQLPGLNATTTCVGTYMVNSDGSGTISITHTLPFDATALPTDSTTDSAPVATPATITASYKFYPSDSGKELRAIRTENNVFIIASFNK